MNDASQQNAKYKVLFLGRHGEGIHNVAEKRYGTRAWDVCSIPSAKQEQTSAHQTQEYWSLLDGDEYGTWVDARLTELGESQARTARSVWQRQTELEIPAPQSYYVSPLNRCCRTAQITFEGVGLPVTEPFRPVIKEVGW